MDKHFNLVTGCSSGGKTTLLQILKEQGLSVVEEPGRRVVRRAEALGTRALPWVDMAAFAKDALEMARQDMADASLNQGPVIFDRGVIDAAVALQHADGPPAETSLKGLPRYDTVFLAPLWPEIFTNDRERRHGLKEAKDEYARLAQALPRLCYSPILLPKSDVNARARFVRANIP